MITAQLAHLTSFEIADLVWSRCIDTIASNDKLVMTMPNKTVEVAVAAKHGWQVSRNFVDACKKLPIKRSPAKVR